MKKWAMVLSILWGASFGLVSPAADFNGDGTADIAVFRSGSGLWAVRGVTRVYFGASGDAPVPGDYDGSGTDRVTIFRATSGLWAIHGLTRVYFGQSGDESRTGDYDGDGTEDVGIFRPTSGLWAARGVTRVYFGSSGDFAINPGKAGGARGRLLKTGQFTAYTSGDDGIYRAGQPFSYTDNGDGTITDNVTGLMWAKDGTDKGCDYGAEISWQTAIGWANFLVFAGYNDWRLPNRRELESLIDAGASYPAINSTYFPYTDWQDYWSGTTLKDDSTYAWCVHFGNGSVDYQDKTVVHKVRAVRGGL